MKWNIEHYYYCHKCDKPVYDILCDCEVHNDQDHDKKLQAMQDAVFSTNTYLEARGIAPIDMHEMWSDDL